MVTSEVANFRLPACLPAGATAAMYLAAAGYHVDVLERRGHPGKLEVDKRRTYLIGLGEGQHLGLNSLLVWCSLGTVTPAGDRLQ